MLMIRRARGDVARAWSAKDDVRSNCAVATIVCRTTFDTRSGQPSIRDAILVGTRETSTSGGLLKDFECTVDVLVSSSKRVQRVDRRSRTIDPRQKADRKPAPASTRSTITTIAEHDIVRISKPGECEMPPSRRVLDFSCMAGHWPRSRSGPCRYDDYQLN